MRWKPALFITAAVVLSAILTGCGGGGGGGTIESPGVTLSFITSADAVGDRSPSRAIYANLDAGATVVVYDYPTGQELAHGTLGADGRCGVRITPGLTVAVVIAGTRTVDGAAKSYRLSMVIPIIPQISKEYVVDPISSMAAEALAQGHPLGMGTILCDEILQRVLDKVREFVDSSPHTDYSLGGGIFGGTGFGASGGIDAAKLADVIAEASKPIDNNIAAAKNAVRQIKDAGSPITLMVGQERPDIEGIFTAVQGKYSALAQRLEKLIMPASFGHMSFGANTSARIFDLPAGRVYTMTLADGKRVLADAGTGTPGLITISYEADGGTYTLAASKSGDNWTEVQTFTGDPQQQYRVVFPQIPSNPGLSPSYSGSISLKDGTFTTPLTFNGTVSASGLGLLFGGKITVVLEGELLSSDVTCSARFEASCPSSTPGNAKPGAEVYEFPSSVTVTNASITVIEGDVTTRLTGQISATTAVITVDGYARAVPRKVEVKGTYTNSHSALRFSGTMKADWSNPAAHIDEMAAVGSFSMIGDLTREGYPTNYVSWGIAANAGTLTSEIELRMGTSMLSGTATGTLVHGGAPYGALTLTNQAGVQFAISHTSSGQVSGTLKAGSPLAEVGTIARAGDMLRITYNTNPITFDEFQVW